MASVSLRNLTKRYDQHPPVLRDLSLDVGDGELLALLGPSGCGKSTLLRCIAGLETPSGGSVLIGDRDVTRLPPGDRNVAMVFQNYALYPHLSVGQNLEFPLRMRGVPAAERARRGRAVAAQLGLEDLLDRLPAQLSGGQRQRVALGRALVREPAAFLLDEPLSNLDAALRAQLRGELIALHRAVGATMVYVTHDQVEALTLGQRLVVLRDGVIEQVGTPAEVYGRPATTFVARFVGTPGMNLIGGENGWAGLEPLLARLAGPAGAPAGAVTLGIRPEDVRLESGPDGEPRLEVLLVEPLGSETLVHLGFATARLIARVPGLWPGTVGSRVSVAAEAGHCHWFDRTGGRLG